ncbi:MAG: C25 family cysteine peptidase [Caldilineaceae bacterium]
MGHAHHWQWASTDLNATPPYLLGLYDPDSLQNSADLSIVMGLTCLTGVFQTPAFCRHYHRRAHVAQSIRRRCGGMGTDWARCGHGHDSLQDGFYHEFWQSPPGTPLGTLVQAGFFELFSRGQCCQETLRTYALLGDPLTAPMVGTARNWIYAPGVTQ